ncbi:MAG TPA: hypothetical protein VM582_06100, partial [Candidatus Thermoplasmatota archaeon]|nr:hypothetical protein [Candidatus Thermoplasmatota archaeon]
MKWLDELQELPPGTLARRAGLALLLAVGVTMTAAGSMFWSLAGPIPFRFVPDMRPVVTILSGLFLGAYAAGGAAHRRKLALWGVVGYVIAFHLEEASVHWIGPFPGSITGTRVGILGTLGSLVALAAVLLLHIEVEHARAARELVPRGSDPADAGAAAGALRRVGVSRVVAVVAGVAAIGALVRVAEA